MDEQKLRAAILKAMQPFGKKLSLQHGDMGSVALHGEEDDTPPVPQTEFTFQPPFYEEAGIYQSTGGIGLSNEATAAPESGEFWLSGSSWIAGGTSARVVMGDYLTVPPGFTRMRVTARVATAWRYNTIGLLGAGSSGGEAVIELTGLNNQVLRETMEIGWVIAPVLWHQVFEGTDEFTLTAEFDLPNSGGEFMVRAGTQIYTWGAANGGAVARHVDPVRQIRVQLIE